MKKAKGYIIAGTNSGCGKTTVSLALMAWLARRGYQVAPFKVGPDFIDPGHHKRITGNESRNLDGWMLSQTVNREIFDQQAAVSDISIVEGVMGLFDGFSGKDEAGSTAQMAKWLGLPVILVVNAQSMARSVAALVKGFEQFDPDLTFAGVIFNRLGSENHLQYLTDALEGTVKMPCLGGILRDQAIEIPERHLGLVTDDEHILLQTDIDRLADMIDTRLDTDRLFKDIPKSDLPVTIHTENVQSRIRIGVARDKAFCFYYRDNLDLLEQAGAELVYFSPVSDQRLPEDLCGIYLGGGYPEVFAKKLSENSAMRADMLNASRMGMPVYAECGGFMYLCRSIIDHEQEKFEMCGCFPFDTQMLKGRKALGYREITLAHDCLLGPKGIRARGHEFHYSQIIDRDSEQTPACVYLVSPRNGLTSLAEGYRVDHTLGSYIHLHFKSNPEMCTSFMADCVAFGLKHKGVL